METVILFPCQNGSPLTNLSSSSTRVSVELNWMKDLLMDFHSVMETRDMSWKEEIYVRAVGTYFNTIPTAIPQR